MQAQDGRKHAELHPAHIQLVAVFAEMMPADVVAPPGVAAVRRCRGKVRLEAQDAPIHCRITRKAERIAMRADPGIA